MHIYIHTLTHTLPFLHTHTYTHTQASTSPGEARNVAMNALLADETKVLTNIQRLKVLARKST